MLYPSIFKIQRLIVKIKRINSDIKVCVVAEDETDKTRILDYGADEFMTKPIGLETVVYKMMCFCQET